MKPNKHSTRADSQDAPKKVFDVARPGKTPASTTSRPVIVGHKPQVQDPMMMPDDNRRSLMDAHHKVTVQPHSAPELPPSTPEVPGPAIQDGIAPDTEDATLQPVGPLQEAEIAPQGEQTTPVLTEQQPVILTEPTPPAHHDQTPLLEEDSVAAILSEGIGSEQAPMQSQTPGQSSSSTAPSNVQHAPLPDISDAHVYPPQSVIVSHHDTKGRFSQIVLIGFILLIIAVVVMDILLDAGFVVLNLPHTHFF